MPELILRHNSWEEFGLKASCLKLNEAWLVDAARRGHVEIMEKLIELGLNVEAKPYGLNALHAAASSGHEFTAEIILENWVDIDAKTNSDKSTALQIATMEGHQQLVKLLLEKGAHAIATDHHGFTALFRAALNGYPEIL